MASSPVEPPSVSSEPLIADELRKLASLRDDGILTDEEFTAQKMMLLSRST